MAIPSDRFYFLSAAGVLNVVLNLIFVIVLHMDVAGVALANDPVRDL